MYNYVSVYLINSNGSINAVVLTCWYEPVNTVIINENIQQYITADCTKQTCFGFQSNVSYLGSNGKLFVIPYLSTQPKIYKLQSLIIANKDIHVHQTHNVLTTTVVLVVIA